MVEHIRVGESGSLAVDCRDVQFITGKVAEAQLPVQGAVPVAAAGKMVITKYELQQSIDFWEEDIKPKANKFCRVIARMWADKIWQQLFLTCPDQAKWFDDYADLA